MGVTYKAISWNAHKKTYDRLMLIGIVLYLVIFAVGNIYLTDIHHNGNN